MNEKIRVAFIDELEKISRATTFQPSPRSKRPSVEEAFYTARRQPPALQRRAEKVKIEKFEEARKQKFPF